LTSIIASPNTIGSHVARRQYNITSLLIELVTLHKSLRILIFLSGLDGVPLLELPLEKEEELKEEEEEVEKGEDELISVCGDVTIGS